MATAGLGAAFLLLTHLRLMDPAFTPSAAGFARIFLVGVGSGISVALIEETVFRGAMHTAIERESGPWAAALLTAPLFAILHFFAKARIAPADVGWGSGFDLLFLSFAPLGQPALVIDSFLSWLMVGSILSLTRVLTGNIAVAIGLHAGWVVVLRMLQEATVSGSSPAYSAWVGRFDGLLGYWLLPWGIAIAAALWLTRRTWVPYARGLK
jgi:membrane protease YdiL (CAAX protease family)